MRKTNLTVLIGLVCLFFFGGEMKVHADSLYQTDFSNIKGWATVDGSWDNAGAKLNAKGDDGGKAVLSEKKFADFEYIAEVKIEQPGSAQESGVLFRVQSAKAGANAYQGYYFGIDLGKQQVVLEKSDGSKVEQIATKKMTLKKDKTYQLKVRASGDHIQGFVDYAQDDYPRIDVVDKQYENGQIGFQNKTQQTAFDNVAVSSYADQPVTGPTYQNPIVPDLADPDVLYHGGTYYLYGTTTNEEAGGIKVYTSTDLTNWTDKGLAMKMGPKNWGASGFWAPDMIERDGKFYMYYTANEHLCDAVSDSPLGPYEQKEVGPMHWDTKEIDAHVFKDDDGQYYLYFVRFTDGNVIWGAKLNDDMRSIDESTLTQLLVPSQPWEQDMARVNEGPYMLKKDGTYFLTYSGAHFESKMYGSGYATSKSPLGPYQKYKNNPIMQSNSIVHGTGHHGITVSPDGTEMFMVYHQHFNLTQANPRKFSIDRVRFAKDEDGQTVLEVHGPTVTPQAIPSGAVDADNFIEFAALKNKEITVAQGSDPNTWELPQTVGIRTSKSQTGKDQQVPINWNLQEYDPKKTDQQVIHGSVYLPKGISNLGKQSLTVAMVIKTQKKETSSSGEKSDQNQANGSAQGKDQSSQEPKADQTSPAKGADSANQNRNQQPASSEQNSGLLPQTGRFIKQNQKSLLTAALVLIIGGSVLLYRRKRISK